MNTQSQHHTFFLSYASEDINYASRLRSYLEARSYTVWFDRQNILWGDDLTEIINRGLTNSLYGIVVLSRDYLAPHKTWTPHEFNQLINNHKIYIILHNIERQHIQTEHHDVYQVIERVLVIDDSSNFPEILEQLEGILENIVGPRFCPLFRHLSAREWGAANRLTYHLIGAQGLLNSPQEDLIKLDSLWRICSREHYGFKIQQKIYLKAMEQSGDNYLKSFDCFCQRVAWGDLSSIINSNSYANTPDGHFPNLVYFRNEFQNLPPQPDYQEIEKYRITEVNALSFFYTLVTLFVCTIIIFLLSGGVPADFFEPTVALWTLFGLILFPLWWIFLLRALPRRKHRKRAHDLHRFLTNRTFISDIPHP